MASTAGATTSWRHSQLHCHLSSASSRSRLPQHSGNLTLLRGHFLDTAALHVRSTTRRGVLQIQSRKDASKQRGQRGGTNAGRASGSFLASFLGKQSGAVSSAKSGARGPRKNSQASNASDKRRQSFKPAAEADSWRDKLNSLGVWLDNLLPEVFEDTRVERLSYAVFSSSVAFLVSSAFVNPTCVVSSSMAPTLLKGDCVLVDIFSVQLPQQPKKGDVVVFLPPSGFSTEGPTAEYVKRVIGTAGDTVEVSDGRVLVNGAARVEEASRLEARLAAASAASASSLDPVESFTKPLYSQAKIIVPPRALYVLGDNRNKSADSHVWGFLPVDKVIGKAWIRFWPLSRLGLL